MRRLLLALIVLVVPFAVAACGNDDSSGGGGGGGDDAALTVYSGRNEQLVGPLLERFEQESGVNLEVRYADTAELAATLIEEGDNSPADVYFAQDAGALGAVQKAGLSTALPQATLEKVPAQFRSTDGAWVGTSARARVMAYDTRVLQEDALPASVFDLTGEEWNGKVGWAPTNGSFQAFVTAMRKIAGDDRTREWLRAMAANGTKVYDNNIAVRDAIAAGEVEVGLINHYYVLEARAEEGDDYPVGLHFVPGGDPGSLVNVAGAAILKTSDQQAQAQQLVDFLLAEGAQEFFRTETAEYPVVTGVAGPEGVPTLDELEQPDIDLSDLDDLEGTLELLAEAGIL